MLTKKAIAIMAICLCVSFSVVFVPTETAEAAWKSSGLYDQGGLNRKHNEFGKDAVLRDQKMYQVLKLESGGYKRAMLHARRVGAHLAIIDSYQKNRMLYDFLVSMKIKEAYFGLAYDDSYQDWLNADGYVPDYTNWHGGEPNRKDPSYRYAKLNTKYKDGSWTTGPFNKLADKKDECYFILEWDKVMDKQYKPPVEEKPASNTGGGSWWGGGSSSGGGDDYIDSGDSGDEDVIEG